MTVPIALVIVLVLGVGLIYSAVRATATVEDGPAFLRWMVAVFTFFALLASLPVVIAF
ncbi:MAG: hypothetical protein RQ751_01045 [Longimicrobiales bacterium]|nr:hypothetical protein [Longimicrobiales bacterium]